MALLGLHLGGGALVALLSLAGEGGQGPYVWEVASAATSWEGLLGYVARVLVYAAAVELALRGGLQVWVERRWGAAAGVLICGSLYGAIHARYGWISALYGLSLGCWVGWWRARGAPLWVFPAWHMQWDLVAIGGVLAWALWSPGPAREALERAYKGELVAQGRLQRHERYGWLDAAHYYGALGRICALEGALPQAPEALEGRFARLDGGIVVVRHRLVVHQDLPAGARRAAAAGIALEAARQEEAAQESAPWWTGLPLSAWGFEDLPSSQAAALAAMSWPEGESRCARLPRGAAAQVAAIPAASAGQEVMAGWRQEGAAQVRGRARGWDQRALTEEERAAWGRIEAARRWWTLTQEGAGGLQAGEGDP